MAKSPRYSITVWDVQNGDCVARERNATEEELREIEEQYSDPWYSIDVEDQWEEQDDD